MTNASAMVLVLLLFIALVCFAFVVILWGGMLKQGRRRGHMHDVHHQQRAA